MKETDVSRFFSKVIPEPNSGCHLWLGVINRGGYGKFHLGIGNSAAHRVAFEIAFGEIPSGLWVCHKCDNRSCVNPDHLYLGTYRDNVRDMVLRGRAGGSGRGKYPYGVRVHRRSIFASVGYRGETCRVGPFGTVEEAAAAAIEMRNGLYEPAQEEN